jgi:hypothetical protein
MAGMMGGSQVEWRVDDVDTWLRARIWARERWGDHCWVSGPLWRFPDAAAAAWFACTWGGRVICR